MATTTHIFVVDDEPGITRLCERLLKQALYSVTSMTDPVAALKYLEKNRVDLLLVDIRMPEVSGFDLIARLHQYQPDAATLVMTGFGTVETAIQALRQGADGLLLKPFESGSELVKAVQQALTDSQNKRDVARTQALRPLFDITESFLAETQPERLLDLVLNAVCGHLRCEDVGFYQYSTEDHRLHLLEGRGVTLPEEESSSEAGVIGRTDSLGAPAWITTTGPSDEGLQPLLAEYKMCSIMVAPISRQNVRGILYAGRRVAASPFREVDWEMFLLLARQAAVAMENARLYEELREYVRRVEASQQALVRAEKMATAGRLTASIAHEINNPLQAVQNCLHLATRKELTAKQKRDYLNLAKSELDRLMGTVQRMLDFYRPGGVDPQPVDIAAILRHVTGLLSPQLKERRIRVATGFSSKLTPILAVGSQLEQVFINIILNAYDAMPEGGELRITARPAKDVVEILFVDTGPGVRAEDRGRIFEPFVSTKEGGTGLGLAVSYGIIAAHGGSLDLLPDRSPGACFRVTLPLKGAK
ncbi:MAG: response regulator [Anaerolineales bacterium]|jgi:signal transduction histidine kinase/FixJ family two-component response regulator